MSALHLLVLAVTLPLNVAAWSRISAACNSDRTVLVWGSVSVTAMFTLGYVSAMTP